MRSDSVVTFDRLEGFRILQTLGVAHGEAIAPRNRLKATFRSIGSFIGFAPVDHLTDAERARGESLSELIRQADELGANAIISLQFEACELNDGSTRVVAQGEAVLLERIVQE